MSDIAKTPREELKCRKKYLYEHSMFFECNDGSKCQILEEDVCDLLNELVIKCNHLEKENEQLKQSNDRFADTVAKQVSLLIELRKENEQLRNELTFLNKVISFFADNPMTKYSSKSELLEEMKLLEEMGLI